MCASGYDCDLWVGDANVCLLVLSLFVDCVPTAFELFEVEIILLFSVLDAGHMVPLDLPPIALEMISNFLANKAFAGRFEFSRSDVVMLFFFSRW
jgi:hypothetical protein